MRILSTIAVAAVIFLSAGGCRRGPETGVAFGEREIRVGERRITVEVARTPAQIEQGLKYRRRLPKDRGMLFIFPRPAERSFWMKDTLIPLSIAFIDRKGRIIDIRDMEPDGGGKSHSPGRPFLHALEMNRGWFEKNNVRVGDRLDIGRERQ